MYVLVGEQQIEESDGGYEKQQRTSSSHNVKCTNDSVSEDCFMTRLKLTEYIHFRRPRRDNGGRRAVALFSLSNLHEQVADNEKHQAWRVGGVVFAPPTRLRCSRSKVWSINGGAAGGAFPDML